MLGMLWFYSLFEFNKHGSISIATFSILLTIKLDFALKFNFTFSQKKMLPKTLYFDIASGTTKLT